MEPEKKFSLWSKLIIVFVVVVAIGIIYSIRSGLIFVDVADQNVKVAEVEYDPVKSGQRDILRGGYIRQVQDMVYRYQDKHNLYPERLEDILVEKDLFTESMMDLEVKAFYDPLDNELWAYHLSADKTHFFLGASMETLDSENFTADDDGLIWEFPDTANKKVIARMEGFGADDRGCNGESGRHCYDIAF